MVYVYCIRWYAYLVYYTPDIANLLISHMTIYNVLSFINLDQSKKMATLADAKQTF